MDSLKDELEDLSNTKFEDSSEDIAEDNVDRNDATKIVKDEVDDMVTPNPVQMTTSIVVKQGWFSLLFNWLKFSFFYELCLNKEENVHILQQKKMTEKVWQKKHDRKVWQKSKPEKFDGKEWKEKV